MAENSQPTQPSLYSKLAAGKIRLIRLVKQHDDTLKAFLEIKALDTKPQYEALSWVWGSNVEEQQKISFPLMSNGREYPFEILPNLHEAITHIMAKKEIETECFLWADYICINQDEKADKGDKKIQLDQMGKIYLKAQRVLVWLGKPPPGREPIAECMKLLPLIVSTTASLARTAGPRADPRGIDGVPEMNHRVWAIFAALVRNSWFRRMWTLQEAALARELVFLFGLEELPWADVEAYVNAYGQLPLLRGDDDARDDAREPDAQPWRWHHAMIIKRYRAREEKGMPVDFVHLLMTGMYKECTYARDRVIAVCGLARDVVGKRIDKGGDVRSVYLDAFRLVVELDPELRLLSFPFERDRRFGLPSWAPDLARWNGRDPHSQWHKPRAGKADATVLENDHLRVRGMALDRVARIGHCPFPGLDMEDPGRRRRLMAAFYRESLTLTQAATVQPDAHWRTLIQDVQDKHDSFKSADAQVGYRYYLVEAKWDKLDPRIHQTAEQQQKGAVYFHHLLHACQRRRYFRSEQGTVGLAPETAQVGDIICVFQGAGVPHVLRRNLDDDKGRSETFSFIGDCYVHNLMESEMVDRYDKEVTGSGIGGPGSDNGKGPRYFEIT